MATKDAQNLLMEAQSYQQQLQIAAGQKEALNMQLVEITKALEELNKPGSGDIYKISGPILIKTNGAAAKKDLESKKELSMLRLKTVEKSEQNIREKLEELRDKLGKAGV